MQKHLLDSLEEKQPPLRLVGRVTVNRYMAGNYLKEETTFRVLKRKSQFSLSDFVCDPEYDIADLDLSNTEEGLYELKSRATSYDIETGCPDDYELYLVPYKEDNQDEISINDVFVCE